MKIFAIFDKNDKLITCFPTREEAENYGKVVLGNERGWEYSIKEKFLHNSPLTTIPPYTTLTPQKTMPCKVSDVPYTPPITVPSPPYSPNIWCGGDAVKDVKATYDNGPFAPGTK